MVFINCPIHEANGHRPERTSVTVQAGSSIQGHGRSIGIVPIKTLKRRREALGFLNHTVTYYWHKQVVWTNSNVD